MGSRDWDYVETRLITATGPMTGAIERLRRVGDEFEVEAAGALMELTKTYNDQVRAVRASIAERRHR